MVCFSLAVIQAKVSPEVAAEVLDSDRALEGLRRYIESQVLVRPVRLDRYRDLAVISFGSARVTIGRQAIRVEGSTLGNLGGTSLSELATAIEAQAQRMAVALVTDKAAAVLRSRYVVKSDTRTETGARTLQLTV